MYSRDVDDDSVPWVYVGRGFYTTEKKGDG
jgi:hypothetical protein